MKKEGEKEKFKFNRFCSNDRSALKDLKRDEEGMKFTTIIRSVRSVKIKTWILSPRSPVSANPPEVLGCNFFIVSRRSGTLNFFNRRDRKPLENPQERFEILIVET